MCQSAVLGQWLNWHKYSDAFAREGMYKAKQNPVKLRPCLTLQRTLHTGATERPAAQVMEMVSEQCERCMGANESHSDSGSFAVAFTDMSAGSTMDVSRRRYSSTVSNGTTF